MNGKPRICYACTLKTIALAVAYGHAYHEALKGELRPWIKTEYERQAFGWGLEADRLSQEVFGRKATDLV